MYSRLENDIKMEINLKKKLTKQYIVWKNITVCFDIV